MSSVIYKCLYFIVSNDFFLHVFIAYLCPKNFKNKEKHKQVNMSLIHIFYYFDFLLNDKNTMKIAIDLSVFTALLKQ